MRQFSRPNNRPLNNSLSLNNPLNNNHFFAPPVETNNLIQNEINRTFNRLATEIPTLSPSSQIQIEELLHQINHILDHSFYRTPSLNPTLNPSLNPSLNPTLSSQLTQTPLQHSLQPPLQQIHYNFAPFENGSIEMISSFSTTTSAENLPMSIMNMVRGVMEQVQMSPLSYTSMENVKVPLPRSYLRYMRSRKYTSKNDPSNNENNNEKPNEKPNETITCSICLDDIQTNQRFRHLPCTHDFHKHCIDKWFEQNVKCPTCRQDIREVIDKLSTNDNN